MADTENDRIQICSDTGSCSSFGSSGTAPGQFDTPTGVALDSLDRIIVADSGNDRIQAFGADRGFMYQFGRCGTGEGEFLRPQ